RPGDRGGRGVSPGHPGAGPGRRTHRAVSRARLLHPRVDTRGPTAAHLSESPELHDLVLSGRLLFRPLRTPRVMALVHGSRRDQLASRGGPLRPAQGPLRGGPMSLAGREAGGTTAKSVVVVDAVSRAFQIYRRPSDILVEMVVRRPRHDVFWAL